MLPKCGIFISAIFFMPMVVCADESALVTALQQTYSACVGIDESLTDLKKMAGINTVITGVGTGLGAGATVVGIVKADKDKQVKVKLEKLREIEQRNPDINSSDKDWENFSADMQSQLDKAKKEIVQYQAEIEKLNKQSKSLGHWRTGLLAGNTVTNVAGAIIAGQNKTDDDLQSQINKCKTFVAELRKARARARMDGIDVSEANDIIAACEDFETVDISKINKRAEGAMVSGIVGVTTGLAGTITSGVANTDKTRGDDSDVGKQKEKNLNTASNVLAGVSTAASGVATIFNATQISAIKKVANIAAKCTEALK